MFRQNIHNRVYFILFTLFTFALPFYSIIANIITGLLLVNWLLEARFRAKYKMLINNKQKRYTLLFTLIYIVYIIGLSYTSNIDRGLFSLQVKLSLVIFPLIFSTIRLDFLNDNKITVIFNSFIFGCALSALVCYANAIVQYIGSGQQEVFFYSRLSLFHHATYFSMYLGFAVAIIGYYLVNMRSDRPWQVVFWLGLVLYFMVFIILLSSKAGVITLALVFFIGLSYIIFYRKRYKAGIAATVLIAAIFLLLMNIFSLPKQRFNTSVETVLDQDNISNNHIESTGERILIWKYSLEIIKENFLFGIGTGDIEDTLVDKYLEKQFAEAYEIRLNAHNQYIETTLALGVTGLIILVLTFLLPLIHCIRSNYILYLLFLVIVGFNLLFESMLERQGGVVFYAFLNAFLFNVKK